MPLLQSTCQLLGVRIRPAWLAAALRDPLLFARPLPVRVRAVPPSPEADSRFRPHLRPCTLLPHARPRRSFSRPTSRVSWRTASRFRMRAASLDVCARCAPNARSWRSRGAWQGSPRWREADRRERGPEMMPRRVVQLRLELLARRWTPRRKLTLALTLLTRRQLGAGTRATSSSERAARLCRSLAMNVPRPLRVSPRPPFATLGASHSATLPVSVAAAP